MLANDVVSINVKNMPERYKKTLSAYFQNTAILLNLICLSISGCTTGAR